MDWFTKTSVLLALFTVFAAYRVFIVLKAHARLSALAAAHGCEPPVSYPSKIPFGISTLMEMTQAIKEKRFRSLLQERVRKYGPTYHTRVLDQKAINTSDPENIKAVFATNAEDYILDRSRIESFVDFIGHGIFTSNGKDWQQHRALIRPSFGRSNIEDTDALEEHFKTLLASIPDDGTAFDLQKLFFGFTIDFSTDILFNASLKSDTAARHRFVEAFDYCTKYSNKRIVVGKMATMFPDPKYTESKRILREYTGKYVRLALEKPTASDRYSFVRELAKDTQDENVLRSELCNILLAARDTTASYLGNLWHVLARRPDIVAKLRKEVDTLNGKIPSWSELKDMKYLQDTLTESLRVHTVVPMNSRMASRPTILPRGGGPKGTSPILLDKGQTVFVDFYSLNHRQDLWGPDADDFVPERWQRKELGGQLGWMFTPFSGGQRVCLGQQMATIEASFVTARLLQEFSKIEPRDDRPWQEEFNMIMSCGNGTQVALWRTR